MAGQLLSLAKQWPQLKTGRSIDQSALAWRAKCIWSITLFVHCQCAVPVQRQCTVIVQSLTNALTFATKLISVICCSNYSETFELRFVY